jgi:hypothetical protein
MGIVALLALDVPVTVAVIDDMAGVGLLKGRHGIVMAAPAEVIGLGIIDIRWGFRGNSGKQVAAAPVDIVAAEAGDVVDAGMGEIQGMRRQRQHNLDDH